MADLKAGPELDALVADHVMKWVRRKGSWYEIYHKRSDSWIGGLRRNDLKWMWSKFTPSTDIGVAWEVVSHMKAEGWNLDVMNYKDWFVSFSSGSTEYEAEASIAPLAICLAALKAVGHE